ncbi:glycosyltransferase [Fulvivirga sedimenti]|uniref:Glycosyltransferase n=1 Tax=Fulvivirga sedimenti TaxID=2879465 RepID=A0A9X1HP95_9BACT|nr:glycosyltransferase [Fulvivirga sedimenti]MCA6074262.1 glycosyltransferase [Fulvivirga sedimenti]
MKIVLISIGTRGDVEPFLAIAERLKDQGHTIFCAFPAQYEKLAIEIGVGFYPLKKEFLEMLDSPNGRIALGGGSSLADRFRAMYKLYKMNRVVSFEMLKQQHDLLETERPDLVLHSLKAMYPISWHIQNPGKAVTVSPIPCVVHPLDTMSAIFLMGKNFGSRINRWSYRFSRMLSMRFTKNQLRKIGISNISTRDLIESLVSEKFIYTISPSLFPHHSGWRDTVKVFGYQERNKMRYWESPPELDKFLELNPSPLFLTFGSMSNPDPEGKTNMILQILRTHGIPAIINTAGGGLIPLENYDRSLIHFVEEIPYDWIFPKVRAVVHHGGAGTTHLALKYGKPSMIIPHIPDQHLWNRIMSQLSLGPFGPSIRKLNSTNFEKGLLDLLSNKHYLINSEHTGRQIKKEDYSGEMLKFLLEPVN